MIHTLTMLIIALAFAVNAAVLSVVLRMRRRRDAPPRIIVKEVPVIREVIRDGIVTVIRKPRKEAEVSDEYMRSKFHERD